jgi:hypothetical protein
MNLKNILCASIFVIPALFLNNAKANTVIEQHQYLARTIVSLGVPLSLNTKLHCSPGEFGSYFSAGFMVICQDKRTETGKQVEWAENDLDTLRHEAHHLIQDCAAGSVGDRKMSLMFNNKEELLKFIRGSGYSDEKLQSIAQHYQKQGVDGYDLLMELEAFAVARSIPANLIADKLNEYCTQ